MHPDILGASLVPYAHDRDFRIKYYTAFLRVKEMDPEIEKNIRTVLRKLLPHIEEEREEEERGRTEKKIYIIKTGIKKVKIRRQGKSSHKFSPVGE